METKKPISHLAAGAILAAIMIVFGLVMYFAEIQQSGGMQWIAYLLLAAGLVLFINLYGKARNNQVSFGNLFAYGFKTTAFTTLIVIVFTVLSFIALPEIKEKIFEEARKGMEEQGKLSEDEMDEAIDGFKSFFWVIIIGGTLLMYAIVGAIASLIGAAITRKRPFNPLEQLDRK
jgi:hypothetical protein